MKKNVFNLIILDESGSMCSIARQAIDGVNETVQTIRAAQKDHEDQVHFVTLISFNSQKVKTIYDNIEAPKVSELTPNDYSPTCGTPLYDAMGNALTGLREKVGDEDVVLVTIITDGEENDSREYNLASIKSLVNSLKAKGWIFTYIGANQNVEKVASSMSITNSLSFKANPIDTRQMFMKESKARARLFNRVSENEEMESMANDYFDDIN